MKKFRLGLTCRTSTAATYSEPRNSLAHDWDKFLSQFAESIQWCMIPNSTYDVEGFLSDWRLDGIILTGGEDLGMNPLRDNLESQIINISVNQKMPILGVCRGAQVIASYFGATLDSIEGHVAQIHPLYLEEDAADFVTGRQISVNSYHSQTIIAAGFPSVLRALGGDADGNIEFFKVRELPIWSIMWHPERHGPQSQEALSSELITRIFIGTNGARI